MRKPEKCDEFLAMWLKFVTEIEKVLPKGDPFAKKIESAFAQRSTIKKVVASNLAKKLSKPE